MNQVSIYKIKCIAKEQLEKSFHQLINHQLIKKCRKDEMLSVRCRLDEEIKLQQQLSGKSITNTSRKSKKENITTILISGEQKLKAAMFDQENIESIHQSTEVTWKIKISSFLILLRNQVNRNNKKLRNSIIYIFF